MSLAKSLLVVALVATAAAIGLLVASQRSPLAPPGAADGSAAADAPTAGPSHTGGPVLRFMQLYHGPSNQCANGELNPGDADVTYTIEGAGASSGYTITSRMEWDGVVTGGEYGHDKLNVTAQLSNSLAPANAFTQGIPTGSWAPFNDPTGSAFVATAAWSMSGTLTVSIGGQKTVCPDFHVALNWGGPGGSSSPKFDIWYFGASYCSGGPMSLGGANALDCKCGDSKNKPGHGGYNLKLRGPPWGVNCQPRLPAYSALSVCIEDTDNFC